MKDAPYTHKARDLAIGFFCWFLIGNLIFWIAYSADWDLVVTFGHPLVTVIAIGTLLIKKMYWFAYGILAALITNALIMVLMGFIVFSPMVLMGFIVFSPSLKGYLQLLSIGLSFPFPACMYVVLMSL